jgi:pimeloyl-ACP methyl ester carboxylesterase
VAADRGCDPLGASRQLTAINAFGSRTQRLCFIKAPTLVVLGAIDDLVPLAHCRDTAKRITSARLKTLMAMVHDLPSAHNGNLADLIRNHVDAIR